MPDDLEHDGNPHTPPLTTKGFNKGLWALAGAIIVLAVLSFIAIKLLLAVN